jgi:hypothetical protein
VRGQLRELPGTAVGDIFGMDSPRAATTPTPRSAVQTPRKGTPDARPLQPPQIRDARWFDEHGWQLEPAELRAALQERGANVDLVVELLDDGADRAPRTALTRPRRTATGHGRTVAHQPSRPRTPCATEPRG